MVAPCLDGVSESDLKRFAICWLLSDKSGCNWDKAAELYDSKVQVQSFKTVTGRAATKAVKDTELEGVAPGVKKAAAGAGGKKRKAASEEGGEEAPAPAKKNGGKGGKKKAQSEEKVGEADDVDADIPIKGEDEEGVASD